MKANKAQMELLNEEHNSIFQKATNETTWAIKTNAAPPTCDLHWHHHTEHFLTGFIRLPSGQLYAFAKSYEFDNGPNTLANNHQTVLVHSLVIYITLLPDWTRTVH